MPKIILIFEIPTNFSWYFLCILTIVEVECNLSLTIDDYLYAWRTLMKLTFNKIYDNYHQDIYRFIFYMMKDEHLCQDLVQDTYIKILQSYSTFRGESSKKTWLLSIARHVVIDYFRSQKRKRNYILDFFSWGERGELIQDHLPLPDDIVIRNEEIKKLYHYLDKCTRSEERRV